MRTAQCAELTEPQKMALKFGAGVEADTRVLRQLDRVYGQIDHKVANIVERGANERRYFSAPFPALTTQPQGS